MSYTFSIENGAENYLEIEPIYRQHYAEMQERLAGEGIPIGPYDPRLDRYFESWNSGYLLNYIARCDGEAVGYSNIYLTHDMHCNEFIATEDTIYFLPEHRNGTGRKLSKFILADLKSRGVMRLHLSSVTDLRVARLWERMGCKFTAYSMTYVF